MQKQLLVSLLLFTTSLVNGQENTAIDSMLKLTTIQKDTDLVKTYNELTWQYRNIDRQKAISFGNNALELGARLNFDKGVAQAYNDMGIIYFDMANFSKALEFYNKAFEIRKRQNDTKGMAALHNKIGILYQKQGNYDKALDNQLKALSLYEKIKFDFGISYSLNNIGIVHQNMGNYDAALQFQQKSILLKEKLGDKFGLAASYVNVGNIYLLIKNYAKCEKYYSLAEQLSRKIGNKEYLSNTLNNYGSYFIKTNQLDKAHLYIDESLAIREQMKDYKGVVSCMANLADVFTRKKQFDTAIVLLMNGLIVADSFATCRPEIPKLYKQLSVVYEEKKDFKNALLMQRKYADRNDSLYTDDLKATFADLQTKYETAQKEQIIQTQQFELSKKNFWIAGILISLFLTMLLGYSYYRRKQLLQQKMRQKEIMDQQDLATKAVIEAEERERKRIASDLHDGVGQMMSAVKMNLSVFESKMQFTSEKEKNSFENIIALVDESCKEVRSVSHNMMPNALLKSSLSSAVKEFIDKIDGSKLKVNLYAEGLNERLDSNIEIVLYRVIQECVNNVIKHAGASMLDISLIKDLEGIAVTIDDNGRGFDSSQLENVDGIGLKNIKTRIEYLKGTLEIDAAPNKGTLVVIHVPAA
jgi:signal transduction histidine kinase